MNYFGETFRHDQVRPAMSPEELDSRIQAAADLLIAQHPLFKPSSTEPKLGFDGALLKEGIQGDPLQELKAAVVVAYVEKFKLLDILGENNGKDF